MGVFSQTMINKRHNYKGGFIDGLVKSIAYADSKINGNFKRFCM